MRLSELSVGELQSLLADNELEVSLLPHPGPDQEALLSLHESIRRESEEIRAALRERGLPA